MTSPDVNSQPTVILNTSTDFLPPRTIHTPLPSGLIFGRTNEPAGHLIRQVCEYCPTHHSAAPSAPLTVTTSQRIPSQSCRPNISRSQLDSRRRSGAAGWTDSFRKHTSLRGSQRKRQRDKAWLDKIAPQRRCHIWVWESGGSRLGWGWRLCVCDRAETGLAGEGGTVQNKVSAAFSTSPSDTGDVSEEPPADEQPWTSTITVSVHYFH